MGLGAGGGAVGGGVISCIPNQGGIVYESGRYCKLSNQGFLVSESGLLVSESSFLISESGFLVYELKQVG